MLLGITKKIFYIMLIASVIPAAATAAKSTQKENDEVAAFAAKFKIDDMNVARNIIKEIKKKYGIKDVVKERIIDVLAKRYNVSAEQFQELTPITLNMGTLAPANTPWTKLATETVIPFLYWETGGLVKQRLYAAGAMGEDADILRKMRTGELQGCGCNAQGVIDAAPELSVFALPMLFDNYKQVDCVLDGLRKDIDAIFARHGYVLIGLVHTGFFYIYTKNNVTTLAQLKKQKINTWFGKVEKTYMNELGIKPIPVSVTDIIPSFQTDTINATITPPGWLLGVQGFVYMHYFLTPPVFYSPGAIFIDKKQLDAAVKRYPQGFANAVIEFALDFMKIYEIGWRNDIASFEKKSLEAFKEEGLKEVRLDDPDIKTMRATAKKTWEQLSGNAYSKAWLNRVIQQRNKCSLGR